MNSAMIKKLCEKWVHLSDEKKSQLRSIRARQGITCDACSRPGFFTQICPCYVKSISTVPISKTIGLFWGENNAYRENDPVKEGNIDEKLNWKAADNDLPEYTFFRDAGEAYSTNMADVTLFQVLRKLIRLLGLQLHQNIQKLNRPDDKSLLVPPDAVQNDETTRKALLEFPEYRQYFFKKMEKKDVVQAHKFTGNIRKIEDLDAVYRNQNGGSSSDPLKGESVMGSSSMYSHVGWKSVLGSDDYDSVSLAEQRVIAPMKVTNWYDLQAAQTRSCNDNYEHLISVIRVELGLEHAREGRLLSCATDQRRVVESKLWTERLDAADRVIQTMLIYKLSSGAEEADFYVYFLKKWRALNKRKGRGRRRSKTQGATIEGSVRDRGSLMEDDSLSASSSSLGGLGGLSIAESVDSRASFYHVPRVEVDVSRYNEYFRNAGLGSHIRDSRQRYLNYDLPALIDVGETFRRDRLDSKTSHVVNQITHKLRTHEMSASMMRSKGKHMTPLYYRYTQFERNGTQLNDGATYQDLAQDRRISTTFSRPLINFSSKLKSKATLTTSTSRDQGGTTLKTASSAISARKGDKVCQTDALKFSKMDSFSQVKQIQKQ